MSDQPVKNNLRTSDNIWQIATGQGDDCTTSCLLDYNCFSKYYKMIEIDLSKQKSLDADTKAIHQINFIGNLNSGQNLKENTAMFFIIEEAEETILDFSQGTAKVLWMCSTIHFALI